MDSPWRGSLVIIAVCTFLLVTLGLLVTLPAASPAPTGPPEGASGEPDTFAKATPARTADQTPPPVAAWSTPLGDRPASQALSLRDCRDVVIENKTFRDLGPNVIAIRIENCSNVTIRAVDFINVAQGIVVSDSSNVIVRETRYSNIIGPHARVGLNRGNLVQLVNVAGGLIAWNKGKGGDTEDIVSIYKSHDVIVEDNHFEGTAAATSTSGCGIGLSDEGGTHNIARRNVLLNPGACGIFIAGGTNNEIADNIVYGEARPPANVGIYVWNQSSKACSGNTVSGNRVNWLNANGDPNPFWDAKNCDATWINNDWAASLDVELLRVRL